MGISATSLNVKDQASVITDGFAFHSAGTTSKKQEDALITGAAKGENKLSTLLESLVNEARGRSGGVAVTNTGAAPVIDPAAKSRG